MSDYDVQRTTLLEYTDEDDGVTTVGPAAGIATEEEFKTRVCEIFNSIAHTNNHEDRQALMFLLEIADMIVDAKGARINFEHVKKTLDESSDEESMVRLARIATWARYDLNQPMPDGVTVRGDRPQAYIHMPWRPKP